MTEHGATGMPAPGQLEVDARRDQGTVVLSLRGELDLTSAPFFERELDGAEAAGPGTLVIDLSGLEFMDSTGLRALLLARERAQNDGYDLVLRRGPRQVQRVLELTKTIDAFVFQD